ncbi:hypothetical protein [Streptococcus macacae]|uniref:Uncharacterized protein n=1 Tax=Streptococcus macacae NCTC 11558 TaxID=764298 RepID=G5JXP8_9STRE|nr:hypothetical protein [Streptococcus macacae]EHJ51844.1 hypothetical protein STRMA_1672 [Streptococcus macacae NCTC 11558]SUN77605.1 Uncharacterised protein [Streptococcus macacae NCTC 11558]
MTEYKGVLEITDYAQELIGNGQARIEGANVIWNPGSGNTGIVEWGKFYLTSPEDSKHLKTTSILSGGIAIGVVTVGVGNLIYKGLKARQNKVNRINNNLISSLSLYILEVSENTVQPSTKLDLKLAIQEYIDNTKLFKNKVDTNLLRSIDIVLNNSGSDDKFELDDKIIQLKNFIEKNNQRKNKKEPNNSSLIRKID